LFFRGEFIAMSVPLDLNPTEPLIPEPEYTLAPGVHVAPEGLRIQYSRGSGPGGQNVNKVNTKAEVWISVSRIVGLTSGAMERLRAMAGRRLTAGDELHVVSEVHRTQEGNRREIFERVRELILLATREPKRRRKTKPSMAAKRKRLESKRKRSEIKRGRSGQDFD
jgi:ribosome-associated protein